MNRSRGAALIVILAAIVPLAPILLKGELPSFRDHEDYFVPMRAFTADAIRGGEIPLWNPLNGSGEPWLANPQTGVFYPPTWIMAILPFESGYVVFLMFHLVLLGLGLRRLFMLWSSNASSTLVAATLVVSGPVLSLLDVSNNIATLAWAPWLIARALDEKRVPGIADTLLLAMAFLGAEPLLAALTWTAWIGINVVKLGRRSIPVVIWRVFMSLVLCAAQLLPFVKLLAGSDRAHGLSPELAFRNSMAVGDWLALLVSPAGVQPGLAGSQLFLASLYVSPIIVLLGLVSLSRAAETRARRGWLIVLAAAVVLASGNQFPLVGWLIDGMQLTVSRYPVKFALFGVIALGALCASGFDHLHELSKAGRAAVGVVAVTIIVAAHVLHRSAVAPVAATGIAVALLWMVAFLGLLWYAPRLDDRARPVLVCVLLPVVVFESVAASRFLLEAKAWPYPAPYESFLKKDARVIRLEQLDAAKVGSDHTSDREAWMGGYLNLLVRQPDISTPAPVIDRRYQDLHDAVLTEARQDMLDFLSVRYVLTERDLSSWGYRPIAEYSGVMLFERPTASPFVTAVFSPRAPGSTVSRVATSDVIPAGGDTSLASAQTRAPDGGYTRVRSLTFTLSTVIAEVDVSHPALIVLNQRNDDGWSVTVDGQPRPAVVANELFRAVGVDAGSCRIVWSYRPRELRAGILLSFAAMIVLAFEWWRVRGMQKKMSRSFHSERA